jgi:hypothetical protein
MKKRFLSLMEKAIDLLSKRFDKNYYHPEKKEIWSYVFFADRGRWYIHPICPPLGFYIDVGAHHPLRYSNTHMLNCRGWR